jgi:antitoxin ParD1/3/4/toxin ParE1/3/4
MKTHRLTPKAEDDLFAIWVYIAPDNLAAAALLEAEFFKTCQRLADKPDLGHFRRDLTEKPLHFFPVRGTYLIVYDPASEPLEVLRVFMGHEMSHGNWISNKTKRALGGNIQWGPSNPVIVVLPFCGIQATIERWFG